MRLLNVRKKKKEHIIETANNTSGYTEPENINSDTSQITHLTHHHSIAVNNFVASIVDNIKQLL